MEIRNQKILIGEKIPFSMSIKTVQYLGTDLIKDVVGLAEENIKYF